MKCRIFVAVVAGLLVSGTVRAQDAGFKGFPDVPKTHWAYQAVTELAQKGILQGYPVETRAGKLTQNAPTKSAPTSVQGKTTVPSGRTAKKGKH